VKKHLLAVAVAGLTPWIAAAQSSRVIVTFHGDPDASVVAGAGGEVVHGVGPHSVAAHVPPGQVAKLAADANVASVSADVVVSASGKPSGGGTTQPAQTVPWGITRIGADAAWGISTGAGVKVAIVDTGVKNDHADLTPRVILGATYVTGTKSAKDDNGHGTHVAGSVGASNNAIGVVGVAPACTLVAVKVLDRNGSGYLSSVAAGIRWAADNGAKVINMSLGGSSDTQAGDLLSAVTYAAGKGVVICAAAGNEGDQVPQPASYPAMYDQTIAVGATDSADAVPVWSSKGSYVDIAAPGVAVKSTYKDGLYATWSGTSMATPHVAGAAAVLIAGGTTDPAAVRSKLTTTADDVNAASLPGKDDAIGDGLLDVDEALTIP